MTLSVNESEKFRLTSGVTPELDIAIVGAGMAGLRAAQLLERAGRDVTIFESSDAVGGRIRSRHVDGFVIDEGFQLLNTAYPELRATGVLSALTLQPFASSLTLRSGGRDRVLAHPLREPLSALQSLLVRSGSPRDLARFGWLLGRVGLSDQPTFLAHPDCTAREGFRAAGLSDEFVTSVVEPFLRGVLLEGDLSTSWRYVQLVLRSFVKGQTAVPAGGMQQLPLALRGLLSTTHFHFNEPVDRVSATSVTTSLATYSARAVIVATEEPAAATLRGEIPPTGRAVTTWWFATPVLRDSRLHLDGDGGFLSNALAISVGAPSYAPAGSTLVAASANGLHDSAADLERATADVARLYGLATNDVSLVATTPVRYALPALSPTDHFAGLSNRDGVIFAGDYAETPSIQGALVSGRRAARAVLAN